MNELFKDIFKEYKEKMEKTISFLKDNLNTVRTGRANPAILNDVIVDYYGVPTPLPQCASINVVEARTMEIVPWDKSILKEIEKAISHSDLGVTPQNDGEKIRIVLPPLTEETRKELVKLVKKYAEEAKVALRNERRDANEKIKKLAKEEHISEDDEKRAEKEVLDLLHEYEKKVDELYSIKEAEILNK